MAWGSNNDDTHQIVIRFIVDLDNASVGVGACGHVDVDSLRDDPEMRALCEQITVKLRDQIYANHNGIKN